MYYNVTNRKVLQVENILKRAKKESLRNDRKQDNNHSVKGRRNYSLLSAYILIFVRSISPLELTLI